MKYVDYEFSRLCEVIDNLTYQLDEAKHEASHYRLLYAESLNESITHSHHMIGGMLKLCLEKPQIFERAGGNGSA
jgi:hypothetical protein